MSSTTKKCLAIALFTSLLQHGLAAKTLAEETKSASPPKVGDTAKDFKLNSIEGESVSLSDLTRTGPAVIVVIRGYPGYQCPICSLQVGDYINKAERFRAANATIAFIYPGASDGLQDRAKEFIRGKDFPENVFLLVDPDYTVVNDYGLRWDAPSETAYPSTFLVNTHGIVEFAKISKTHGDRTKAKDILSVIETKKGAKAP